jgi:putative flavoprotein involved in K+ transport
MPRTETAQVLIVGGGAAGLSVAGSLKLGGVQAVIVDRDSRIGGTWARRYDRLHLHTVRRFSGLAHLGLPDNLPRYVSKDEFADYLQTYATSLGLDVRLGEVVRRIELTQGGWQVATDTARWEARVVVLATGRHREPVTPTWVGVESFRGQLLHAHAYQSGTTFAGARVLVVGLGNSGAEIATDLVEQGAAFVAVSVRTRPPIMPRDVFGLIPAQLLGVLFSGVPAARLLDGLGAVVRRLGAGDLQRYGLGREAWGPFTSRRPAVIDVGFVRELKAGRVHARGSVERLTSTGVVFCGGLEEAFDVVVAATGYRTALDEVLAVPEALDGEGRPRFASGQATPIPGLYFIGYDDTTRGAIYEANLGSRRLARIVARYLRATP